MIRAVIDTNVLLVANGKHQDASDDCLIACTEILDAIENNGGTVVVDDEWRILREYQNNLRSSTGQPGPGDTFLKWLLRRQANPRHVARIAITETDENEFAEFPDRDLQENFDPNDRKFVAVSAADLQRPPIIQAVDSKWLDWWQALARSGVTVDFRCPDDICRYYREKFGDPVPDLPDDD